MGLRFLRSIPVENLRVSWRRCSLLKGSDRVIAAAGWSSGIVRVAASSVLTGVGREQSSLRKLFGGPPFLAALRVGVEDSESGGSPGGGSVTSLCVDRVDGSPLVHGVLSALVGERAASGRRLQIRFGRREVAAAVMCRRRIEKLQTRMGRARIWAGLGGMASARSAVGEGVRRPSSASSEMEVGDPVLWSGRVLFGPSWVWARAWALGPGPWLKSVGPGGFSPTFADIGPVKGTGMQ